MGSLIRIDENSVENPSFFEVVSQKIIYDKTLSLVVNKNVLLNNTQKVKSICKSLAGEEVEIKLFVDGNVNEKDFEDRPYIFTSEEKEKLIELNNFFAGIKNIKFFGFVDINLGDFVLARHEKNCWNLQQILDANEKLDAVVEDIKKLGMSPFETMLYIHDYVSNNFGYSETDGVLNRNAAATIVGAFEKGKIVCVGASSLTKAIIDKLDMPGLSCEVVNVSIHTDPDPEVIKNSEKEVALYPQFKEDLKYYKKYGDTERHRFCLIHLVDAKYGVNGDYLNDVTWDGQAHSLAMCCYPVSDVQMFANDDFVQTAKDVNPMMSTKDLSKEAFKLVKLKRRGKYVPYVVEKYGKNSAPIDLKKYKNAFEVVCAKTDSDEQSVARKVGDYMKNSEAQAKKFFRPEASSKFVHQKDKKTEVELKNS